MARPLSVGAKLALRYTAAMAVTTTVFAGVVYDQVARRINREAALLVEVQLRDLADAFQSQSREHPREHVLAWMEEQVRTAVHHADPALGLGVELLGERGEVLVAAGSLAGAELPLPHALLSGEADNSLRAVNIGGRYAHLSAVRPVDGGFLRIAIDTTRHAENVASVRRTFVFSLPLVLLMTAGAGWYLAAQSLKPIAAINATARRVGSGNLRELVPVVGTGDELDELAVTLNDMLARIREGVDRMHRFNANAAHQLRTPLAAMRSEVDVTLERPRTPDEYRSALADVREDVQRMSDAVDAMLRLARSEEGLAPERRRPVEIATLLDDVIEFFAPLADEREVKLVRGPLEPCIVLGDPVWLHQLFANLVSNAIQHTHVGTRVEMTAARRDDGVEIRIADTGPGIADPLAATLFDRFERGATEARGGFGLGLPIAREIARAHGGRLELESRVAGAAFSVWLPVAPDAPAPGAEPASD